MRKFLYVVLLAVLFSSCSNLSDTVQVKEKDATLKEVIATKESDISWTKPLEEERLTKSLYTDSQRVDNTISITPEVASVIYKSDKPVYPELKGFASLDISGIPINSKFYIDDFCKSVSENIYQIPRNSFDPDYIFNYVFFKNDLISSWKDKFNEDFPIKNPAEIKEEDKKDTKVKPLFEKWILGKPFIGDEIMQQPVRFYCQQGFLDVTLYINLDNNKIYQILEGTYD